MIALVVTGLAGLGCEAGITDPNGNHSSPAPGTPGSVAPKKTQAATPPSELDSTVAATTMTPTLSATVPSASTTATHPIFLIEQVFLSVDLESPIFLTEIPDGTGRLAMVEQRGMISSVANVPVDSVAESSVFLDIRNRVNRGGNEEGLLGLAFHPNYGQNGRFFVHYSAANPRRSVISELVAEIGGPARPASERVILEVPQPYPNHNGGMIAFGPDGFLYVALGDGGSAGDPLGHGQNRNTLLGSILRIDIDVDDQPYGIPPDNPFADGIDGAAEVWAYGLRNPWRFAFDPATESLWVADVGQNRYEEVSIVERGGNYGWNVTEGPACFGASTCTHVGVESPVAWYDHGVGCSITGGYVNRDPSTPALNGSFVVADYCSGTVWIVDGNGPNGLTKILDTNLSVTSFGEDAAGHMYIVSSGARTGIYRLIQHE